MLESMGSCITKSDAEQILDYISTMGLFG